MQPTHTSSLHTFRKFMAVYSSSIMAVGIYATTISYLQWLTHWGVCACVMYYTLQLVAKERMKAFTETLFQVTLTIEWVLTVIYWTFVFPQYTEDERPPVWYNFSVHFFMFFSLFTDFHYNEIEFDRKNRMLPLITIFAYGAVNVTVTLLTQPIYPLLTYRNVYSYVFIAYSVAVALACFELCCWMNARKFGKSSSKVEASKDLNANLS